ncbi:MAG: (2Fe-2S)-binding protein [Pseudomonadota bacterium]
MKQTINLTVNDAPVSLEVEPRELLVDVLRQTLGLTGTHVGCDTGQCGACVVHVNGQSIKSCTLFAVQADGAMVTTIEGIGSPDNMHPLQQAFQQHHGLQCGFCTPGMVMSTLDLLAKLQSPDEQQIRQWLDGNLCRCTGYHNIVLAVEAGAQQLAQSAGNASATSEPPV